MKQSQPLALAELRLLRESEGLGQINTTLPSRDGQLSVWAAYFRPVP